MTPPPAAVRGGVRGSETIERTDPTPAAGRASIIPFPIARRRVFIAKLTAQMLARPTLAGEAHLSQQMRRQAQILARKGVPAAVVAHEVRSLEAGVRAESPWAPVTERQKMSEASDEARKKHATRMFHWQDQVAADANGRRQATALRAAAIIRRLYKPG